MCGCARKSAVENGVTEEWSMLNKTEIKKRPKGRFLVQFVAAAV
jgi:hypothetical protein